MSQEERRLQMKEKHAGTLKKMTIEEREDLYANMKKGENRNGGTYGNLNDTTAVLKTNQTFKLNGATLRSASWTRTDCVQKGWGT